MNPLLARLAPYLIAVLLVGCSLFGAYRYGCTVTQTAADLEMEQLLSQSLADQKSLSESYRKREAQHAQDMAAAGEQFEKDKRNAQIISERTIAGLRDGTLRLRDKFAAYERRTSTGVSDTGTSTSQRDAASSIGLQTEDVEFLVRFASRADEVADQLRACQAVVRKDRGQ